MAGRQVGPVLPMIRVIGTARGLTSRSGRCPDLRRDDDLAVRLKVGAARPADGQQFSSLCAYLGRGRTLHALLTLTGSWEGGWPPSCMGAARRRDSCPAAAGGTAEWAADAPTD